MTPFGHAVPSWIALAPLLLGAPLSAQRTPTVHLTLRDSAGAPILAPVALVRVRMTGPDTVARGRTGPDGRVALRSPCDGPVQLVVHESRGNEAILRVVLPPRGALAVQVKMSWPAELTVVGPPSAAGRVTGLLAQFEAATARLPGEGPGDTTGRLRRRAAVEALMREAWTAVSAIPRGMLRQALVAEIANRSGVDFVLAQTDARRLFRELDATSPFWETMPLSSALFIALRRSEFPQARPRDSALAVRYLAVLDSIAAHPRTLPRVREEMLAFGAVSAMSRGDSAGATRRYRALEVAGPTSPFMTLVSARVAPNRAIRIGRRIPALTAAPLDSTSEPLSRQVFNAPVTLVDLWATWCGPCVTERPLLREVHAAWHDQGFDIVSVSFDSTPDIVRRFLTAHPPMPWRHFIADRPATGDRLAGSLAALLEVVALPRAFLVNEGGIVIAEYVRPDRAAFDSVLTRALRRASESPRD